MKNKTVALNIFYTFLIASFIFASCNNEPKATANRQPPIANSQATYKQISPIFNADSAFYFTQKQVDFGPRVTNSPEHKKCGDWIVSEFKKYVDNVIEQKAQVSNFEGKKLNIRNIIAEINPSASNRILICAHWDSRPYADEDPNPANHNRPILAADDAASGVAVMIEMARVIKQQKLNIGIDFICFDAEDWGKSEHGENSYCLGSQYWGANRHTPNYKANYGILMDMVGGINAHFGMEGLSMRYAEDVVKNVWNMANQLGYSNTFVYIQQGGITDDHKYVTTLTGIPTIDIINYTDKGFAPHWHTVNDNMSIIDKNTLKAVGQTLLEVIYTQK
jgi:Zn-dependent M28 family amino/carboxypeptidase